MLLSSGVRANETRRVASVLREQTLLTHFGLEVLLSLGPTTAMHPDRCPRARQRGVTRVHRCRRAADRQAGRLGGVQLCNQ